MDSARKRKAAPTSNTPDGSASKKIRLLNSHPAPQPAADVSVQKVGLKLLSQLNNATDKNRRSIADAFLELPPRDQYADYYDQIKMPIALDLIEEKLRRNAYPTVTALESDFKRMIQNAKEYNMPKSDVYEDAERIRKLIYNYMKQHNPAYSLDPSYSSFPTPFPESSTRITLTNGSRPSEPVKAEPKSRDASSKPKQSIAPKVSEPPSERRSSAAPSATTGDADGVEDEDMDFTGKSFQDAQLMIIAELIRYSDDDGLEIFTPFVNLPSRRMEDYYKTIRHPVSLKGVQKRIRGQHGRNPATGINDFKTWNAFEEDVSFIWRNARAFNEDGSEMYELAGELEDHFKMRLAEAKEKIEEPAGPRIKIGGPKPPPKSGITLNLSQHRDSPTPGVSVDNDALLRQRQMVQAGVNGRQTPSRPPPAVNGAARPPSQAPNPEGGRPSSSRLAGTPPGLAVKNEKMATMSPVPVAAPPVQPATNGMMPPPIMRPTSSSPYPTQPGLPTGSNYHYTAPALLPPTAIRPYPVSQALLPVVTISTHPQLRIPKPYSLAIPPHASLSHQSTTITLPASHYFLQIAPTISRELSMGRAYKMFVTVNGTRLTQRDTQFQVDTGKRTHVYEGSLASGVNRVEVEVVAAKADEGSEGKGLDVEKVVVFANLTRQ